MDFELATERSGVLREAPQVLLQSRRLAPLLAQDHLVVDQIQDSLRVGR